VTDKEVEYALKWYYEMKDTVYAWLVSELGVAVLIFLMYVTYHLISKLRGNERNVSMNTFGIGLAGLGFVNVSGGFIGDAIYLLIYDKWDKWTDNHQTLYFWIWWSAYASNLLFHWFFNLRYVKSTFRLPLLKKSAEFFNEMLNRILEQREDQNIVFTAQELEDHSTEMA